jgi:hypothetical protein
MRYQVYQAGEIVAEAETLEEARREADNPKADRVVYDTQKERVAYQNWEYSEVF